MEGGEGGRGERGSGEKEVSDEFLLLEISEILIHSQFKVYTLVC